MITIDEIYSNLKESFEERSGLVLDDGGDMALRFYAVAAELVSLWAQSDYVNRQCFPQTAGGEILDRHAALRGLTRGGAVKAHGTIRFSVSSARTHDLFIPRGVRCMTASLTEFITTEEGTLVAGETYCDVPAEAVHVGKSGNAGANEVNIIQNAPVGIRMITNPLPFTGGEDEESDDDLRERVLKSYGSIPNGGNVACYEKLALNIAGVAAVKVLPRNRGRGTVDIIVASDSGMPSDELLDAVSEAVDERREICVDIDVSEPTATQVNVTAAITVSSRYDTEEVLQAVREAVAAHFSGRLLGKSVLRAELGNVIYAVPGVENYSLTAPANDVSISSSGLPVLHTLSISEA